VDDAAIGEHELGAPVARDQPIAIIEQIGHLGWLDAGPAGQLDPALDVRKRDGGWPDGLGVVLGGDCRDAQQGQNAEGTGEFQPRTHGRPPLAGTGIAPDGGSGVQGWPFEYSNCGTLRPGRASNQS
jgi:hypothetical protein